MSTPASPRRKPDTGEPTYNAGQSCGAFHIAYTVARMGTMAGKTPTHSSPMTPCPSPTNVKPKFGHRPPKPTGRATTSPLMFHLLAKWSKSVLSSLEHLLPAPAPGLWVQREGVLRSSPNQYPRRVVRGELLERSGGGDGGTPQQLGGGRDTIKLQNVNFECELHQTHPKRSTFCQKISTLRAISTSEMCKWLEVYSNGVDFGSVEFEESLQ